MSALFRKALNVTFYREAFNEEERYYEDNLDRAAESTSAAIANGVYVWQGAGYALWLLRNSGPRPKASALVVGYGNIVLDSFDANDNSVDIQPTIYITV